MESSVGDKIRISSVIRFVEIFAHATSSTKLGYQFYETIEGEFYKITVSDLLQLKFSELLLKIHRQGLYYKYN